jgi:redox-sensitive bicupin YhaK (pirin superfamily)
MGMSAEIRRGTGRFVDRERGRVTYHSFSFGDHYDADRLAFGPMVCHDDHLLGAGRGFDAHAHSGLEIVTWVVSGTLEHTDPRDPERSRVVVVPGSVAHLSAGSGVEHAERATPDGPCRFVQVWLRGDPDAEPRYDVRPLALDPGRLVPAVTVGGSSFAVARLAAGDTLTLPVAPLLHVFVATGALIRSSLAEPLAAGDAFLLTDPVATEVTAAVPTDLLVWSFAG